MKNKRNIIYTLGVVVVLVLIGVYFQNREVEMKLITNSEEYGEFIAGGGNEQEYLEWVKELEKQDNFGGKTPEETLELYIKALEARDFELASKYFVLEDQEREFKELDELSESDLVEYLLILKLETRSTYLKTFDEYEFDVFYEEEYVLITRFVKNKETDIWKLESI